MYMFLKTDWLIAVQNVKYLYKVERHCTFVTVANRNMLLEIKIQGLPWSWSSGLGLKPF